MYFQILYEKSVIKFYTKTEKYILRLLVFTFSSSKSDNVNIAIQSQEFLKYNDFFLEFNINVYHGNRLIFCKRNH